MKNISSEEKIFINKVWKKIHLLNFQKRELELVKQNNIRYLKRAFNMVLLFIIAPLFISAIILLKLGFDQFTFTLISLFLFGMCSAYEYYIDLNITGEE